MSFFRSISRLVRPVTQLIKPLAPVLSKIMPLTAPTLSALTGSLDPVISAVKTYAPAMEAAASFALPEISSVLDQTLTSFDQTSGEDLTDYMPGPVASQAMNYLGNLSSPLGLTSYARVPSLESDFGGITGSSELDWTNVDIDEDGYYYDVTTGEYI